MKEVILSFMLFHWMAFIFAGYGSSQAAGEAQQAGGSKNRKLKDIEGNTYHTQRYNHQTWMTQNLIVTRDRNGDSIPSYFPNSDTRQMQDYGLLYDYPTACKVCPQGWHLPSSQEWIGLIEFVGKGAAGKMQDSLYWKHGNQIHTNESGFSIRPAGYGNTEFDNYFGTKAILWSATPVDSHLVWGFVFSERSDTVRWAAQHPTYAFSVRCVKGKTPREK